MKIFTITSITILLLISESVFASGLDDLQRFYSGIKSYSASFEQTVRDEKMNLLEASSGELSIQRPGKFRWHYTAPSEQLIVGDGKQVWIYDVELEQITHRQSDAAVTQTPAMLLSGEGDLAKNFILEDAGRHDGLDWVRMIPKNRDSGFTDIHIGFSSGSLKLLELQDSFGQTTQMRFNNVKENSDIPEKTFTFTPPPGVDVIEEAG
ncbi:outer-membrane lipoprotein carrier protein precursor [bacterium BMS3Bbin11]|nr:outer-membrane lipoprotein carrier protein precursor [bacterium BMS3Abin11]GBE45039.1 outer-membrane lipoprotein carrier protein precursor [bacterium BMS3Bbin11]GMT41422.1 MAG: outer-membrane lipoprotein carrier protein [bacterium]HDH15261.1 outer membrane lipoprotein chaperone LolA [Gammaproteobacteria bacterium]HDZ78770.1 outer membrane lipoprotein chaperone LolA [Gammaproteobacteria bacterium]